MAKSSAAKFFDSFKNEADFWLDALSLNDWYTVSSVKLILDDDIAQCAYDCSSKIAFLAMNERWLDNSISEAEPTEANARLAALHEVLELSLADLIEVLLEDPKNESRIDSERHRVIHRFEKILFPLKAHIAKGVIK